MYHILNSVHVVIKKPKQVESEDDGLHDDPAKQDNWIGL